MFRALSWPVVTVLQGLARHGPIAVLSIAGGLANLGLSIALIQELGVIGVAYGTLIPTVIEAVIVLVYGLRIMEIGLVAGVRATVAPALVAALPATLTLVALRAWLQPTGIDALPPAMAGVAVYAVAYGMLGSTRPEREIVRSLVDEIVRRRPATGG
jgi:O-antigen/teichoic acid export membrane protein